MDNISKLDSKEENLKILKSTVLDKSKSLYPTIMQEKIIIELDKLLNDSGLKEILLSSPVEVASVEKMVSPEIQKAESSLKAIADEYSGDATKDETSNIESNNEIIIHLLKVMRDKYLKILKKYHLNKMVQHQNNLKLQLIFQEAMNL